MPKNVLVKNVPDDVMDKLRKRAKRHHRSLQGELMAILEEAVGVVNYSLSEADTHLKSLNYSTGNESAGWVRELRDGR